MQSLARPSAACLRLFAINNSRQPDRKRRAAAGFALDRDIAAHHLAEPLADREPKPGAAVFARRGCVGLRELLKQLAHLLRRHADAGIGNLDDDAIAAILLPMPRFDGDAAALGKLV